MTEPASPQTPKQPSAVIGVVILLVLVACLGGGAWWLFAGGDDDPAAAPTTPPPPAASSAAAAACLDVPAALVTRIGIQPQANTGLKMTGRAGAAKSANHTSVYAIAAEFEATGVDKQIGVWTTNSLDGAGGVIYAVDGFAAQFTTWKDAAAVDGQLKTDPAVDQAKSCLK